jgi:hypothetical protein
VYETSRILGAIKAFEFPKRHVLNKAVCRQDEVAAANTEPRAYLAAAPRVSTKETTGPTLGGRFSPPSLRCLQAKFFICDRKVDEVLTFEYRLGGSVYAAAIALDLFLGLYGWCDRPRVLGSSGPR